MSKVTLIVAVLLVGSLAAGGLFLLTWDIPPPSSTVEKVLPDDQFPK